jgi:hypothetical protein
MDPVPHDGCRVAPRVLQGIGDGRLDPAALGRTHGLHGRGPGEWVPPNHRGPRNAQ